MDILKNIDITIDYISNQVLFEQKTPILKNNINPIGLLISNDSKEITVSGVVKEYPAEIIGIEPGDRILNIDGINVENNNIKNFLEDLNMLSYKKLRPIKVKIKRGSIFEVTFFESPI